MDGKQYLIGRANERRRILDSVDSHDIRIIALYGPKYVGKSILLQTLASTWLSSTKHRSVYFDVQKNHRLSLPEKLDQLAVLAVGELQIVGAETGHMPVRGDDINFWHGICGGLAENESLVLIIDSLDISDIFDVSVGATSQNGSDKNSEQDDFADTGLAFCEFLTQLLACSQIKLILGADVVDSEPLTELFPQQAHQIRTIYVDHLNKDETEQMLHTEDVDDLVHWDNLEATERVWSLTNGHPSLIKAVGSAVSDYIFQDIGDLSSAKRVTMEIVDAALPKVVEEIDEVAEWYWTRLSSHEQLVASIITYLGPGFVSGETIQEALNAIELSNLVVGSKNLLMANGVDHSGPNFSQINLRTALTNLQKFNLIDQVSHMYRLPMGVMHEWILENKILPEEYANLIDKASLTVAANSSESLPGGAAAYSPGSTGGFGRKLVLAMLMIGLTIAIASIPFLSQSSFLNRLPGAEKIPEFERIPVVEQIVAFDPIPYINEIPGGERLATFLKETTRPGSQQPALAADADVAEITDANVTGADVAGDEATVQSSDTTGLSGGNASATNLTDAIVLNQDLAAGSPVWSVAVNIENNMVAAGLNDGSIGLWGLDSRDGPPEKQVLDGHTAEVFAVAFDPVNGARLASASADNTIRIWDIERSETILILDKHKDEILTLAYRPDGQLLASGSADATIRLWNPETGELVGTLGGEHGWVLSVAFDTLGNQLASGTADGTIQTWDTNGLQQLDTIDAHKDWVSSIAYAPSGNYLASASYSNSISVWRLEEGQPKIAVNSYPEQLRSVVNSIAFHPYGDYLISAEDDGAVSLWNISEPAELLVLSEHQDAVRSVLFSPNGQFVVSGSLDGTVHLREVDVDME